MTSDVRIENIQTCHFTDRTSRYTSPFSGCIRFVYRPRYRM